MYGRHDMYSVAQHAALGTIVTYSLSIVTVLIRYQKLQLFRLAQDVLPGVKEQYWTGLTESRVFAYPTICSH